MPKILIIDDDRTFLDLLKAYIRDHYPALEIEAFTDPVQGLASIHPDLALLLIDLEMPGIDGAKILSFAIDRGVPKNRIIILSGRDADYLHRRFPMGRCLAVLNKHEVRQKAVLDMVFKSLQQKCRGDECD